MISTPDFARIFSRLKDFLPIYVYDYMLMKKGDRILYPSIGDGQSCFDSRPRNYFTTVITILRENHFKSLSKCQKVLTFQSFMKIVVTHPKAWFRISAI